MISNFIDFIKNNPVFLAAFIILLLLLLSLIFFIIKLIAETKQEKQTMNTQYIQNNNRISNQVKLPQSIYNPQHNVQQSPKTEAVTPITPNLPVANNPTLKPDTIKVPVQTIEPFVQHNTAPINSMPVDPVQNIAQIASQLSNDEVEIGKIPTLDKQVKNDILNSVHNNAYETQPLFNETSSPLVGETEILVVPKPKQKPLAVISYTENNEAKEYSILNSIINIGRDPEFCDFIVSLDNHIGRKHALLYCKNGKFFLADLNSKNGTFINGEKLQGERQLFNDDIITLASTEFKFNIN